MVLYSVIFKHSRDEVMVADPAGAWASPPKGGIESLQEQDWTGQGSLFKDFFFFKSRDTESG